MSDSLTKLAEVTVPIFDPPDPPPAGRARPLPAAERRAALVAATQPLVARHGTKVTTRQIAEAAGVAEGTIFRVFPDKEALIRSAVAAALDPAPVIDDLEHLDPALPMTERMTQLIRILQRRLVAAFDLLIAVGWHGPPAGGEDRVAKFRPANEAIHDAVVRALTPDEPQFRCSVEEVARLLRLLTFSGTHPILTDGRPLTAEQIAALLLDGVRHRC